MNHILGSPASLFSVRTCPYMHGLLEKLYHILQSCKLEDLHCAFFLPFRSWCRTAEWHCCLHTWHVTLLQEHNDTRLWSHFRLTRMESHLLCHKLDRQTSVFPAYFGSIGLNHICRWRTKFRYRDCYPQTSFRADISNPCTSALSRGVHPLPGVPCCLHSIGYHCVTEMGRCLEDMDWDGHTFYLYRYLINRCQSYKEQYLSFKDNINCGKLVLCWKKLSPCLRGVLVPML